MSFVGIMGSKRQMCERLVQMMDPATSQKLYIDLFAGGGDMIYEKEPRATINVLNDLDPDVVVTHRAIQSNHEAVQSELRCLLDDDWTFERIQRLRESQDWETLPEERRAAMVIFVLKESVNSKQTALSSWSRHKSGFNPNLDLSEYAKKLEQVQIRHWPYEKCLRTYLPQSSPIEAFVFADPPYVAADTQKYYRFNFHPVEHIRFWHVMTRLSKDNGPHRNVKIMVTYDDHPLIRALYRESDGWRITPMGMAYNSAHDHTPCRSELVITNYDVPLPGQGLKPGEADQKGLRLVDDWADVPELAHTTTIDGVPFEQMSCCDKERSVMLLTGTARGQCRVCEKKLVLKTR